MKYQDLKDEAESRCDTTDITFRDDGTEMVVMKTSEKKMEEDIEKSLVEKNRILQIQL